MSDAGTTSPSDGNGLHALSSDSPGSEYTRSFSALPAGTPQLTDSAASLPSDQSDRTMLKSTTGLTEDEIALKMEHARQKEIHRQMFEQHMAQLERKHQEEQNALRAQSASRASSLRAPGSRTVSPQGPNKLPFFADDPEEGLHGSNVPGLRSMPHSRRQSGDDQRAPSAGTGGGHLSPAALGPTAVKPGRPPRSRADLVYSFERLNVGSPSPSNPPGTPGTRPAPQQFRVSDENRAASPGAIGPRTSLGSTPSQNGLGGGALNSSRASSPVVGKRDVAAAAPPGTEGSNALPSVFSETYLLDDELDAESAFVKKYHLEDDTKFDPAPGRGRRDSFPEIVAGLSSSSAALDLAPLTQTNSSTSAKASRGRTSEWPVLMHDPKDRMDRLAPPGSPDPRLVNSGGNGILPGAPTSASAGHLSPISGRGTPTDPRTSVGSVGDRFESGFSGLYGGAPSAGTASGFGVYGFDSPAPNGPSAATGGAAATSSRSSELGVRPSSYFDAFNSSAGSAPSLLAHSGKYSSVLGQETNKLPPASTAAAAAAAAAAAGLKQSRKGELDANTKLEDLQGEIFALCKDQHGCRYLQKKLEDGNAAHRDMIFSETFPHFAELMTDPFGNYLCQKMLEYCSDDQRNLIVESVAGELVRISLNMHGTRAVQKTIDFLSTPRQIHSIIVALSMNVVTLIKDLNGNHVIQKCLNRLDAEDNQFIYNAVAAHTVEVATHRHGCCVLQRCIDHASDAQRIQLVQEITYDALTLVQDPFGNYVVQYVLDLNDPRCSEVVIAQFIGNVCALSVQKFSSNVMEKCIRVSAPETRKRLIDELIDRTRLEKLLRDSFANYVVQTALDYAEPLQRMQLVECIRPILPVIRNTPYGKRIQSKLQRESYDLHGRNQHGHGHHGRHGGHGHQGGVGRAPHAAMGTPYAMYPTAPLHPIPMGRPEYDQAYMNMAPGMAGMMGLYPGVPTTSSAAVSRAPAMVPSAGVPLGGTPHQAHVSHGPFAPTPHMAPAYGFGEMPRYPAVGVQGTGFPPPFGTEY